MKVLLSGAFGSLGSLVIEALLERGHSVIAFDLNTKINRRIARKFVNNPNVAIAWGDVRDKAYVENLVKKADAVIHLAAIIVPLSEHNPDLAYEVNVTGTRHIVDSIQSMQCKPFLAYCSSFAVFGPQESPPPRTPDDIPIASDHYTSHKIAAEKLVQSLSSPWVILRLGGMADARMRNRGLEPLRYALSLDANSRFEYIHPADAATAFVNALTRTESHNRIHLIGGGRDCQVTHKDVLNATLAAVGITLVESDFGTIPLYADWADTHESQQLLNFQNHSFADFRQEMFAKFRLVRPFVRPLSPFIKRVLKIFMDT